MFHRFLIIALLATAPGAGAGEFQWQADKPEANAGKIDPSTTNRLISAAPGLVFAPPMRIWPDAVQQPASRVADAGNRGPA